MFIPYSTDAPIYYYPIATISFIVINVVCFLVFCLPPITGAASPSDSYALEYLILEFGHGWLPWQWVTSMFMHAGIMHLIGNMIFLWSFGLVVEGKLGNVLFAFIYLGMGIAQDMIVQTMMLFSEGGALGASGVIFSVLALALIFAPVNSFEVLLFIVLRPITFEVSILMFGFFYVAMNFVFLVLGGGTMSSEALHLIGFAVGVPVGLFLLTKGIVDCEGYDIISHLSGTEGRESRVGKRRRTRPKKQQNADDKTNSKTISAERQTKLARQVSEAVGEGYIDVAVELQHKLMASYPEIQWQQSELGSIIQHYLRDKQYVRALPLIERHLELFDAHRYKLQNVVVRTLLQQQQPRRAMRYLQSIDNSALSKKQIEELRQLARHATKMIDNGILEIEEQ